MKCSPATRGAAAIAFLLAVGTAGRADPITWTYSWSNSPTSIAADKPCSGYLTLSNESTQTASGDSDVVVTNIQGHSTAPATQPDTFTDKTYSLGLTLTDQTSGTSGNLTFTGELNGVLTAGSSHITNTFTGFTTQSLVLGGNLYVVSVNTYTAPGPPGSANPGSIGATATVSIFQLPEPGSFALWGIGAFLALVGMVSRPGHPFSRRCGAIRCRRGPMWSRPSTSTTAFERFRIPSR
jgi:hypothetical protein